ncbi:unnamed protein product [Trypanosoma congolense IL3000]|uniref:WGS project CAEQ00000000 data, annotated contig 2213 n=1 Tax=Trypanosoma congolense (strain IL3000) TaxID=1068625 RepID=F9WCC7_TRYCI|nr:unnamed protein product [Trypanosoma congolense IL3000]
MPKRGIRENIYLFCVLLVVTLVLFCYICFTSSYHKLIFFLLFDNSKLAAFSSSCRADTIEHTRCIRTVERQSDNFTLLPLNQHLTPSGLRYVSVKERKVISLHMHARKWGKGAVLRNFFSHGGEKKKNNKKNPHVVVAGGKRVVTSGLARLLMCVQHGDGRCKHIRGRSHIPRWWCSSLACVYRVAVDLLYAVA